MKELADAWLQHVYAVGRGSSERYVAAREAIVRAIHPRYEKEAGAEQWKRLNEQRAVERAYAGCITAECISKQITKPPGYLPTAIATLEDRIMAAESIKQEAEARLRGCQEFEKRKSALQSPNIEPPRLTGSQGQDETSDTVSQSPSLSNRRD